MENSKKQRYWFFLFFLFYVSGSAYAEDPLWQKAVALAGKNINWLPGRIVTKSDTLDDKGKVTKTEEISMKVVFVNNESKTELEQYLENGKDVTEKKRKEFNRHQEEQKNKTDQKNKQGYAIKTEDMNPFLPASQANLKVVLKNPAETSDGKTVASYEYTQKFEQFEIQGKTWLDTETGVPLRTVFTYNPLPPFTNRMGNELIFKTGPNGEWYPDRLIIEGSGSFLLININMRIITIFLDYKRRELASNQ